MTTSQVERIGLSAVAGAALEADSAGRPAVAGRVVDIQGFSTWAGDELIVVEATGTQHGWVLGEVGGRAVREAAMELLGAEAPGLGSVAVEIHGQEVIDAGLSCGGRAELLLQPTTGIPRLLWTRLSERAPVALLTRIEGPAGGPASMVVDVDGTTAGQIAGDTDEAIAAAVGVLASGHSATRRIESDAGTVLVEAWIPTPRLIVVGTGDLVGAISTQAGLLGWDVMAVEDRPAPSGATGGSPTPAGPTEQPDWPTYDRALAWAGVSAALVVLSHDPHIDVPAIAGAIDRAVPYVGAMGSRRTQSRRIDRLKALGRTDEQLAAIHRPIGLDLGGRGGAEVALSICAEILAAHCGRDARPLKEREGPINDRPVAGVASR